MNSPAVFLLDNGSLEPAAVLCLRGLAAELARRTGQPVEPVSLLHSSGVPVERIDGVPAEILEPALRRRAQDGQMQFAVVPLFFGPSRALTDYLPERVASLRSTFPSLSLQLAAPLFAATDDRLAAILAEHVQQVARELATAVQPVPVALVDHGSPAQAVTEVRDQLARQLGVHLGDRFSVKPCSMERRAGPEFAFAEPLLAGLLQREDWARGDVIVAMQFLQPGRHAGRDGDVARICRQAEAARAGLRTRLSALVGEHPLLLDILVDRLRGPLADL